MFSVFRPAARDGGRNAEPERFEPERWLTQPAHAYVKEPPMPFGGGPPVAELLTLTMEPAASAGSGRPAAG